MRTLSRFHSLCLVMFACVVLGACSRKVRQYDIPRDAVVEGSFRSVRLKQGDGRPAMDGEFWAIRVRLMSHAQRGCAYPCEVYLSFPRFDSQLEPWNKLVKTMREGEVRRVWFVLPEDREPRVYEIELARVSRSNSAGEAINE
jgi:hypothetical protein